MPRIGADLRTVLAVASNDLGDGVRIVSVECYAEGLVVRWLISPLPGEPSPDPAIAVADDVGTSYRFISGGAFGHLDAARGDAMFVPAPPAAAAVLTVCHRGRSVAVDLSSERAGA